MKQIQETTTYTSFLSSFPKKRVSVVTPNTSPPIHRQWTFFMQKANFQKKSTTESNPFTEAQSIGVNGNDKDVKNSNTDELLTELTSQAPIIFFSGLYNPSESYYQILLALSAKGLQVLMVDIPRVDSMEELVVQFVAFCEMMHFEKAHLAGVEFGAFAAQYIADRRPDIVASLCLINPFLSNEHFVEMNVFPEMLVSLTPAFILRKILTTTIPQPPARLSKVKSGEKLNKAAKDEIDPLSDLAEKDEEETEESLKEKGIRIANKRIIKSVDFIKHLISKDSGANISSRINLYTQTSIEIQPLFLDQEDITIIQTLDQQLLDKASIIEVQKRYTEARFAHVKDGGDFPQLGNYEEVIMHVLLHLRRIALRSQKSDEPNDENEETVDQENTTNENEANDTNDEEDTKENEDAVDDVDLNSD